MALWVGCWQLPAQTTQGLISGRVIDQSTGRAVPKALVIYENPTAGARDSRKADENGYYALPLLPPGTYRLRAEGGEQFQPREFQEIVLAVAGFLEVNFELRPLADVMDTSQSSGLYFPDARVLLDFYGPDVDSRRSLLLDSLRSSEGRLEATVSTVISPREIQDLPLAGRDLYTTLVLLPSVTADTASSGGLGLAINGQRTTSSNYLLDGVENNNYLIAGPLATVAPEAMQEYRISTSTFSAEYGGTGGVLANAVTRRGGTAWHGSGYFYWKNDALNANDFQRNFARLARPALHEIRPGFQAGGPLRKERLFASGSFERLRSRSYGDPVTVALPSTGFLNLLAGSPGDPNAVRTLNFLHDHPWPVPQSAFLSAPVRVSLPSFVDRSLVFARGDYTSAGGLHHVMARFAGSFLERPQFIWSPYQGFDSPLDQNTYSLMGGLTSNLSAHRVNEARVHLGSDNLWWDRSHPEIPGLSAFDALLPGSLSAYSYRNRSRHVELSDQLVILHGRHLVKVGGGLLVRSIDGYLTFERDGEFSFQGVLQFGASLPSTFSVALDRGAADAVIPPFDRRYSNHQFHTFAQDTFRATPRLTVNYGMRYENFGAPGNTGSTKDLFVNAGSESSLRGAKLAPQTGEALYQGDNTGWAVRLGASYALTANGGTVLRGGYGIFYDRPYDNLWENVQNNRVELKLTSVHGAMNYLTPAVQVLPQLSGGGVDVGGQYLTWIAPELRNGYVHSAFAGIRQQISRGLTVEVDGMETLGRRLITTDRLNRGSIDNPTLPLIYYRANQGASDYAAMTALVQYRTSRTQLQAAYTWSHSLDNQSSPLSGDYFNLYFTGLTSSVGYQPVAAFSVAGDTRIDRGNSDFDQRQNLVIMTTTGLPAPRSSKVYAAPLRDWHVSLLAAFRTGFPYSVYTFNGSDSVINARGDLVNLAAEFTDQASPGRGGRVLLNRAAFTDPAGFTGNLGRNNIAGPGLYNLDFSLGRSIRTRKLGEAGRVQLRADAFNVLNHANLGNPNSTLGSNFGLALYGRKPSQTGFPGLIPLTETPRQIQLMMRVEW